MSAVRRKLTDLVTDKNELVVLRTKSIQVNESKKTQDLHAQIGVNSVNLRIERFDKTTQTASLTDIVLVKEKLNKENYHFETISPQTRSSRNFGRTIRFFCSAFLVLLTVNLINIVFQGFHHASNLSSLAQSGLQNIQSATESLGEKRWDLAQDFIQEAEQNFNQIGLNLSPIELYDSQLSSSDFFENAGLVVRAAQSVTKGAGFFLAATDKKEELYTNFKLAIQNMKLDSKPKNLSITEDLKVRYNIFLTGMNEFEKANELFSQVNIGILPSQLREKVTSSSLILTQTLNDLNFIKESFPVFLKFLGERYPHRVLLVLQNSDELRPTGGFIGSYALFDLNNGFLSGFSFHDVYELDNQLFDEVPAPEEIALLTDNWRMRDANYSPDFSISAKKIAWFLEKQNGPGVDSVIAINSSILRDLLEISGPVEINSLNQAITHENYRTVLTFLVESKFSGSNTPKDVIAMLIEKIQQKLTTEDKIGEVFNLLMKKAKQKEIFFYSKDQEIQNLFDKLSITGSIPSLKEKEDFLHVSISSIGGNKSDYFMKQKIRHQSHFTEQGTVLNSIDLERSNLFSRQEETEIRQTLKSFGFDSVPDYLMNILGKGINKAAIKIYVPAGSKLLSTEGIEQNSVATRYDEDLKQTYFYFISEVAPQQIQNIKLNYQLPFEFSLWPVDSYRIFVKKQAGFKTPVDFEKKITSEVPLTNHSFHPQEFAYEDGAWIFRTNLQNDRLVGGVWSR
jgi:hypothetical protein